MKLNVKLLVAIGFLYCLLCPGTFVLSQTNQPDDHGLLFHWTFDKPPEKGPDSYTGSFEEVTGVHGMALKFDGFTALYRTDTQQCPENPMGPLTVESWIALASYPWALVAHCRLFTG